MIREIIIKGLLDYILSLRFSFSLGLVLMLMVANALVFIKDYDDRLREYSNDISNSLERLREKAKSLSELAIEGPGGLYKSPSHLAFCAKGGDDLLPKKVEGSSGGSYGVGYNKFRYFWKSPWRLSYPQVRYRKSSYLLDFTELDWSFIVGVVMSFVAILFTFDAISGERERGTLQLVFSNPISRGAVLLGKLFGALIGTLIPLAFGILVNLLIINLSGVVQLEGDDWVRIGVIIALSVVYLTGFLCLGLVVSTCTSRSSTSLVTLLLVWVILVVLSPNTLGSIAGRWGRPWTTSEFSRRLKSAQQEVKSRYPDEKLYAASPSEKPPKIEAIRLWARYLMEWREAESRVEDEHLNRQLRQVKRALQITRFSPTAIFQYALQAVAGTGLPRHEHFIAQVRRYKEIFEEFIRSEDRKDPNSLHIWLIKEGLSQRSVHPEGIPKFVERYTLMDAIQRGILDIGLLALFCLFLFMGAFLSFLRAHLK
jgi:hypothetical protein